MVRARRVVAALAASALFGACTEVRPGSREESFKLRVGDTAKSESAGIRFRFDQVVSDSRCPKDVNCIRAGEAVVRFAVSTEGGKSEPLDFRVPPGGSDDARFRDFRITILELNPQTESGRRIELSDYEVRVKLSRE